MAEKHLSTQFDSELNGVSSRVLELGGLVESQLHQAIYALAHYSAETAKRVIETEARVNAMEIEIDRELSSIIARRQPTARDLRLLMAISKTTTNLERAGDEAVKVARMAVSIMDSGIARTLPSMDLKNQLLEFPGKCIMGSEIFFHYTLPHDPRYAHAKFQSVWPMGS